MAARPDWRDYRRLRERVARLEREHPVSDTSRHAELALALAAGAGEDGRAVGGAPTGTAGRPRLVLPETITVPAAVLERVLDQVDRAHLAVEDAAGQTRGRAGDLWISITRAEQLLGAAVDQLIAWLDGAMAPFGVCVDWGRDEGTCYSEITATDDRSHPAPVTAPDPRVDRAPEPGFLLTRRGWASVGGARRWRRPYVAWAFLLLALVAGWMAWLEVVG